MDYIIRTCSTKEILPKVRVESNDKICLFEVLFHLYTGLGMEFDASSNTCDDLYVQSYEGTTHLTMASRNL